MRIDTIHAREILDTRGRPTIETTLVSGKHSVKASVPSGKSTGSHEAYELRDADGSVATAINNVNETIAKELLRHDFASSEDVDALLIVLDSTADKSRLGANAILSVSIAAERLFATSEKMPLWRSISLRANIVPKAPRLYINVLNGGVHADFRLPFQEYMLVIGGETHEALATAHELFMKLGKELGRGTPMGDEGGYAPSFDTLEAPFEILTELIAGYKNVSIAIDAAASEFYSDEKYHLLRKEYSADELLEIYESIVAHYPIHSIEDPFSEDSEDDFSLITREIGDKTLIVGDDITVTDPSRIANAITRKEVNAVLIKPNQIGTIQEAILAVHGTRAAGFKVIVSHRSGETDDTFIADFAYGVGAHGIKAGGLGQKERLEKYDRLLAIEHESKRMW